MLNEYLGSMKSLSVDQLRILLEPELTVHTVSLLAAA